jgi:hypothetical protein
MESVIVMVPAKPFRELTETVEVAGILASTELGEVAVMLKSVTVTAAAAVCERVPLAPVIVSP